MSAHWTDPDTSPADIQQEPEGPALGNYPPLCRFCGGAGEDVDGRVCPLCSGNGSAERRTTVGEKIARFLNDLAEKVRGVH